MDDDDPTVGQKFSTETLRRGDAGRGPIPSSLHGAPETAEESREVLARLKRMAGFESQDFDPGVRACCAIRTHEADSLHFCLAAWPGTSLPGLYVEGDAAGAAPGCRQCTSQ